MSGYGYSSDEDVNIRFTRRRGASPPPREYGYAEPATRQRPVSYFPVERPYLAPERTMIRTRSRSRERYRQSPPASPPAPAPAPVIIHNQIYNDQDSDDDYRGKLQVARPRRERSRSRGDDDRNYMTREQYEIERTRQQMEEMRLASARDRDDTRAKGYRTDAELRNAKRELDQIKAEAERAKEQERIKKEIELERVKEEAREAEEKEKREKEAALAIEKYKAEEAERKAQEKKAKELAEKEYQRRLQEQLIASGLDEKQIEAILKKERIKKEAPKPAPAPAPAPAPMPAQGHELARPTYTRMSRRHLSIETLRVYHVDFDYDQDPEYILIKRWVPEWEQNTFWMHTREIREKRSSGGRLVVDVDDGRRERRRSGGDPKFEWVRKKESGSRKRSKSPALLMYLAGAKPA